MKKLEDYKGQKIAIHFPTYELWSRRKEINNSDDCPDIFWKNGAHYYAPFLSSGTGDCFKESHYYYKQFKILPSTDFLKEEFIYGQEHEFSNNEEIWFKRIFLCKTPSNVFISWNKDNETHGFWNYARKINTDRNEAITTIKELVSKFSINQNEVF